MKTEMILRLSWTTRVKAIVRGWTEAYASLFSSVLEEKVTSRQAFCLTHAAIAFMAVTFAFGISLLLRILLLSWFVLTLYQCRKAGLK